MHFAIRFLTEYHYDAPVTDNLNSLRVRPATTSTQRCDEFHTRIEPEARIARHLDYFGTEVIEFGVPTPHDHLTIDVRARVVTSNQPDPREGSWESLRSASYTDAAGEFALPWQDQPTIAGLEDLEAAISAETPLKTLERLCQVIPERFEYRPGATYVGSGVDELLRKKAGVCQDFAHLSLVLLRRMGIAARYVSGYLWAAPDDAASDSLEVDTHAWVEALLPDADEGGEPQWVSVDPTNRRLADSSHVKIGHGRFYADVAPVKGLFIGGATSTLSAAVTLSLLDPQSGAKP
ncbi:MAG TPA: transglutaminase family protein [Solirubrobacteraceae bacterium]|nr:transglutaminase family protein [Solirubrobacteraceae bacterium]